MPTEILMPALSPTMEEGKLVKWLVAEGDSVAEGDLLAEIDMDKATLEFEATGEGVIGRILVAEGTGGIRVGTPIALLLAPGETASDLGAPATAGPEAATRADARGEAAPAGSSELRAPPGDGAARIPASPLARRIAAERGVDLRGVTGSGPGGRIIRADLDRAVGTEAQASMPPRAAAPDRSGPSSDRTIDTARPHEEVALDTMRSTIAARMSEASRTVPQFTLRRDIRVDALLACRDGINRRRPPRGAPPSLTDFIVKACALALQAVPEANAIWAEDRILRLEPSDLAVAVAVEGGVCTPVLRDAEMRTLSDLSAERAELATQARNGRLAPEAAQGGALAISNLGMFGVESFDAIVTPPQSAILAIGAAHRTPVVDADGAVTTATVMSVSLGVDHRVFDGATGATLLREIAEALEHPLAMLA
jgi:pyruvate dehydrogenase E2 component (dihydrolipoamide acetyltransferase)